jgi:hypothetical protein
MRPGAAACQRGNVARRHNDVRVRPSKAVTATSEVFLFPPPHTMASPTRASANDFGMTHKSSRPLLNVAAMLACVTLATVASLHLGQDANWDLQNYHYYNPFAFVTNRRDWDLAPAQLQSYFNPLLDLPFFWAVQANIPPRLISAMLTLPAGFGYYFFGRIVLLLFADLQLPMKPLSVAACLVLGVTGSMGVSLLGSTMNEWPGSALTLIAIWFVLRSNNAARPSVASLVSAGLCLGIASGLKLTAATYAVGLLCGLLARRKLNLQALVDGLVFGLAVLLAFFIVAGYWLWTMYQHYANPVFPFFNDIFRSPWWDVVPLYPRYFGPHTALEWISFPLKLFETTNGYVTEVGFRDWRMPLLYILSIAAVVISLAKSRLLTPVTPIITPRWRVLMVFWASAFALWAVQHSIYRYTIPLELLGAPLLVFCVARLMPAKLVAFGIALVCLIVVNTTQFADWWRVPFGDTFFSVQAPDLPPNALVVMTDGAPLAFIIPYLRPDARFLGGKNNFNSPGRRNLSMTKTEDVIRSHDGPLFSLQSTLATDEEPLEHYGLERTSQACTVIKTNMSARPFLCPLRHAAGSETRHDARRNSLHGPGFGLVKRARSAS